VKRQRSKRSPGDARLFELHARLDERGRGMLLEFAEYLAARAGAPDSARVVTLRPARESVLHAVRRLNRSYPMLGRAKLMRPVGDLLSEHLVDGRDAVAVIDELEALYAAAFGEFAAGNGA
jgi:hypothetical protein